MNVSFYQTVPLPLGLTLPVSLETFFLPVALLALALSVAPLPGNACRAWLARGKAKISVNFRNKMLKKGDAGVLGGASVTCTNRRIKLAATDKEGGGGHTFGGGGREQLSKCVYSSWVDFSSEDTK
jgi:hypothetical protein